jgi:hypothetical protein
MGKKYSRSVSPKTTLSIVSIVPRYDRLFTPTLTMYYCESKWAVYTMHSVSF